MTTTIPFRKLSQKEITLLESKSCTAENWSDIEVHPDFNPEPVSDVHFSGQIKLGVFEEYITLPGGLKKHSGLHHVTLHHCEIGNHVYIGHVQNYIANYIIQDHTYIENIHLLYTEGRSMFGNGIETAVLNETGGREVLINDKLSAHFAYIMTLYRHRPVLIQRMQQMVRTYAEKHASDMGTIGSFVRIINTGTIKNVKIGDYAQIEGANHLINGSINSNVHDPVHMGYGVMAEDFIISSGSSVEDGTMLSRCFVGQACRLGHTYSASDSLFFSNCVGENGEACSIFAGPYTVTHHKSTLLISGMFSFMNAGSGSNQSNHMYKLGPIHQGIIERGAKTTSDSYMLWPAKIGAFSLIMGRHYRNSDTSDMPFSYLIENNDESILVPGVNLKSVGTIRDAQKFPRRDERKDINQLDQINFNLLSPYTIQKMFRGIDVLKKLQMTCGETSDTYTYQSCKILNKSLQKGIFMYTLAIHKFLGNSIISRLKDCICRHEEEIRTCLKPESSVGLGEWRDIAGLLAPSSEIDRLMEKIESGEIYMIKQVNAYCETLHSNYYQLEWTWAWDKIQQFYHLNPETITAKDIIEIIVKWKEAVIEIDRMIYEDARKEFSLAARTGFGVDGNQTEQTLDFEQVRGAFEKNAFVEAVLRHMDEKTKLGDELIDRLNLSHTA